MSNWSTRVKARMKELEITQDVLAGKMGVTRGAITHYLAGRRQPPLKQFQKLAAILKCDPAWLQYGTQVSGSENQLGNPVIKENESSAKNPLPILSWEQTAEFADSSKLGRLEINEFVAHFFTDKSRWYGLRVNGDSMTASSSHSKCFHEGDIVIIDPDKTAVHGSYVIAVLPRSKEATFKQYVVDGGLKYLKPLNSQYPITQIDESTHFCGVVVGQMKLLAD